MLDLFGEVPITLDELDAWVCAVAPAYASTPRSLAHYIRHWNVVDKVRSAKLRGTFDTTIQNARRKRAFFARRFGVNPTP